MKEKMNRFEFAFRASEGMKLKLRIPKMKKATIRAFEAAKDDLELTREELETSLDDLRDAVYTAETADGRQKAIQAILDARADIKIIDETIADLAEEADILNSTVDVTEG